MPSIVVPLDESELSESALPVAKAFAADSGSDLVLMTVVDVSTDFAVWIGSRDDAEDFENEQRRAQEYLDKIAARVDGVNVRTVVRSGRPEVEILRLLDEIDNPLVVMSSHGRSGFDRLMVGSVANRIVASADCPVVVVHGEEEDRPAADVSINTILVPLDGSSFAENALEAVQSWLSARTLKIHLVRIPEMMTWAGAPYGGDSAYYQMIDTYMDAATEEAQIYLEEVATRLRERGHDVSWEVRSGMTAEEISAAAADHNVDLIVMATHGRTGFRRVVMGSVAERIFRDASVPLMLVRPHNDGD